MCNLAPCYSPPGCGRPSAIAHAGPYRSMPWREHRMPWAPGCTRPGPGSSQDVGTARGQPVRTLCLKVWRRGRLPGVEANRGLSPTRSAGSAGCGLYRTNYKLCLALKASQCLVDDRALQGSKNACLLNTYQAFDCCAIPAIDFMAAPTSNVAFVTGCTGISGNAIVENLIRRPKEEWWARTQTAQAQRSLIVI